MMKHLVLSEYGTSLGLTEERCVVKQRGEVIAEYPLSRLYTITIAKEGVSISSNCIQECALRGIRLFFLNRIGECTAALSGIRSHGVGETRRNQVLFLENGIASADLAIRVIYGKIRNQRATLCYLEKSSPSLAHHFMPTIEALASAAKSLANEAPLKSDIRPSILGIEGAAAHLYWDAWVSANIFPSNFRGRSGRGAGDVVNAALNYGYGVLSGRIWNALLIAGLEPYLGFYHTIRPGKPSLVLDLMEEYRPWCVDRIILKNRTLFSTTMNGLTSELKKRIIEGVESCFATHYTYHGRKLSLDSILQRQVYRLCGLFAHQKKYKPYLFKW